MTKKNEEIDLGKKQHQTDWDKVRENFKKLIIEKEEAQNKRGQPCPHCGRCPTCGKTLWPTPHGPGPCHEIWERTPSRNPHIYDTDPNFPGWQIWSSGGSNKPGTYTDGMGLFVAID